MTFANATKSAPRTGIPCSIAAFLKELAEKKPAEVGYFKDFLFERDARGWAYSYTDVLAEIAVQREKYGYTTVVGKQQVNHHRAGRCRCAEESA